MQNVIKAALLAIVVTLGVVTLGVVTLGAPVEYVQAQIWVPQDRIGESRVIAHGWTLVNQSNELEWAGAHSPRAEFAVVVARSELAWNRLWAELSQTPPVALDSDNQIGIAVFHGLRRTGGFAVNITTVEDGPVFYTVNVTEKKPAPEAIVTQALTTPYVIRIVPHSDRPVMFRRADVAAGNIYLADTEFEIADAWIRQLWTELQQAQQDSLRLHDIIDEAERQIEQLQREKWDRCQPCGVLPTEGD